MRRGRSDHGSAVLALGDDDAGIRLVGTTNEGEPLGHEKPFRGGVERLRQTPNKLLAFCFDQSLLKLLRSDAVLATAGGTSALSSFSRPAVLGAGFQNHLR